VFGEPDLADPVHARVGGEYTLSALDAENFEAPAPRADIAPGSGVR
jgi:uronate dehydrogenase